MNFQVSAGHTVARTAIDLFAGAGGATQGLEEAGIKVIGAVEFDLDAASSYEANHPAVKIWKQDIRTLPAKSLLKALNLEPGELTLLKACPPCQGFSSLAEGRGASSEDPRNDLVSDVVRFVRALLPQVVLVENVRGLGKDPRSKALAASLTSLGYANRSYLVDAADFGVPQKRTRFILLAVKGLRTEMPKRLDAGNDEVRATVRAAFGVLEHEVEPEDPLHKEFVVSDLVRRRIEAIPVGGNRFDLPVELQLDCHVRLTGPKSKSASGSYGRLKWDEAAPTMTTRCTTPACGSFIHPELHRPITLREAASIQTFPARYKFVGARGAVERQIGNAVPVRMARQIAEVALRLLESK